MKNPAIMKRYKYHLPDGYIQTFVNLPGNLCLNRFICIKTCKLDFYGRSYSGYMKNPCLN